MNSGKAGSILRRLRPESFSGHLFLLQAAIASLYADARSFDETDSPQILTLYDRLAQVWPSPVVELNRVVPLGMVSSPRLAVDLSANEAERAFLAGQIAGLAGQTARPAGETARPAEAG